MNDGYYAIVCDGYYVQGDEPHGWRDQRGITKLMDLRQAVLFFIRCEDNNNNVVFRKAVFGSDGFVGYIGGRFTITRTDNTFTITEE